MDHILETLRHVATVVAALTAVIAPIVKLFNERRGTRPQALEERYRLLKTFFDDGGVDRHPLLVESGFAAAVGHARLSAIEVALVLKQRKPSQFLDVFMRSRAYVQPTDDGLRFRLVGIAQHQSVRRILVALGMLLYVLFVAPGMGLLFFQLPRELMSQDWRAGARVAATGLLCAGTGFVLLYLASQIHWAAIIVDKQASVAEPSPTKSGVTALSTEPVDNSAEDSAGTERSAAPSIDLARVPNS